MAKNCTDAMLALLIFSASLHFLASNLPAAENLETCQAWIRQGKYEEALANLTQVIEIGSRDERWWVARVEVLLKLGRYEEARANVAQMLNNHRLSAAVRFQAAEVYRLTGEPDTARQMLDEITQLVSRIPWQFTTPPNLVLLGRSALAMQGDPRQILEVFFDRAKKEDPTLRETYLAAGQLALDKHDYQVAANSFLSGLKHHPQDADLHFGLAQAYASTNGKQATEALKKALELNPRHVPALLYQAEDLLDREQYDEAEKFLQKALAVNPADYRAWTYRAVLAHLKNQPAWQTTCREYALCYAPTNPEVDHLLGRQLSSHYRFAEGSAAQRQALAFDPDHLAAKMQLSQDLLRLGQEEEGWRLADEVHEQDGYDVATFNLLNLRDRLAHFRTLETDHFTIRMDSREADIYGQRVVDLLERARATLCSKYGLPLEDRITVEIFPKQEDFAIRTFGLPGGAGFLGVCFGKVITANSPASATGGNGSNWESVLWHEFCHVVTLELTRNRMPRWLSEGISVYEERQAHPTWGQRMNMQHREFITGGQLTPVSKLSGAFLSPPSGQHLQFAYYESSLVVEFFIQNVGLDSLRRLLADLGAGMNINDALERHTGSLIAFESAFEQYARRKAAKLGPKLEWEKPEQLASLARNSQQSGEFLQENPNNFWGLLASGRALLAEKKYEAACKPLEKLAAEFPDFIGEGCVYDLLAQAYRGLKNVDQEQATLAAWAARDDEATHAYLRLMELAYAAKDWPTLDQYAQQFLGVNPLTPKPYRLLAEAYEERGLITESIATSRSELQLEPLDPAVVHFRLARLLHQRGDPAAKRHVLQALEDAPRFRAAHHLLLEITRPPLASP